MNSLNHNFKKTLLDFSKLESNVYSEKDTVGLLTNSAKAQDLEVKSSRVSKNIVRTEIIKDNVVIGYLDGVRPSSTSNEAIKFIKNIDDVDSFINLLGIETKTETDFPYYIRINIIEGVYTSATLILPPFIVGDNQNTIEELITKRNDQRSENAIYKRHLFEIDDPFLKILEEKNLNLDSVLASDELLILDDGINLTAGPDTLDVSEQVSKQLVDKVYNIAATIPGLSTAAIDIKTDDYTSSNELELVNISVSPNPRLGYLTSKGQGINIYENYVRSLIVQHAENKNVLDSEDFYLNEEIEAFKNQKIYYENEVLNLDTTSLNISNRLNNIINLSKKNKLIELSKKNRDILKQNLFVDEKLFKLENNSDKLKITPTNVLRLFKYRSDVHGMAVKAIENEIVPFPGFDSVNFDEDYYYTDKSKDYGASYQLYIQSLRIVAVLLLEYEKSKNILYLYKAEELIYSWITFVSKGTEEKMVWYDHPTANRTQVLIHYLYLVQGTDIEVDHDLFRAVLVKHAEELSNDAIYFNNNHGLMMDKSLMVLGHILEVEKYFLKGYYRSIDTFWYSFSSKGTHLENSPEYHNMVVRMYTELQKYLESNGKSYNENVLGVLEIAKKYLNIIVKPDMRLPSIGDSGASPRKGKKSYENFYDHEAGMSVMQYKNEKSYYVNFVCGYSSRTHKHRDDLAININYNGEDFITDPGKFNYNSKSPSRKYMVSKQSHSSFQLSKHSYSIKRTNRFDRKVGLDGYNFAENISVVKGYNKDYSNTEVVLKRAVIQIENQPVTILYDYIENPTGDKHEFTQNFNLASNVTPEYSNGIFRLSGKKENLVIRQFLRTSKYEIVDGDESKPVAVNTIGFSKVEPSSQLQFHNTTSKDQVFLTAIYDESVLNKIRVRQLDDRIEIKIDRKLYLVNI